MIIQPIVEGDSEVASVPILLRKICYSQGCYKVRVAAPIKMHRHQMAIEQYMRRFARIASVQPSCSLILILLDADDDCSVEIANQIKHWLTEEALEVPFEIIVIQREYEAWLIANMESLRGKCGIKADANSHSHPETVRDAKGYITSQMSGSTRYHEVSDQPSLTNAVDPVVVSSRCKSFSRLTMKLKTYCQLNHGNNCLACTEH
jgi:hypothetical protein